MEQQKKNYAVIHVYGYLQSKRHADLVAIYPTKEEADDSISEWKKAREQAKRSLEDLGYSTEKHKPYVDKFVVFGYFSDSIASNSNIAPLFLKMTEGE